MESKSHHKRHFSDIAPREERGVKKWHSWITNRGTVIDLAPTFYKRRPIFIVLTVIVAAVVALWGGRHLFTRAEVADFYPNACLGAWNNPQNAQGKPENLALGFASSTFDASNAASFAGSSTQIFCGGFMSPDFKPAGNVTRVGITFVWNVSGGSVPPGVPELATSTAPEAVHSIDSGQNAMPTTMLAPKYHFAIPFLDFLKPALTAFADDASVPSSETTATSDLSPAEPPADSSGTIVIGPPLTAPLAPVKAATTSDQGREVSNTPQTSTATEISAMQPPAPDENFLEVSYSVDGSHWVSLAKVNRNNWQNFTISLPITNWDDLQKLQVRIGGIPTSLAELPSVLLDGMFVETQYEIPPVLLGGSGIESTPGGAVNTEGTPVVAVPSLNVPVPVGGDNNFKANEAPAFDLDLNGLPAPAATPPAESAPAPSSSPTSFFRSTSHALASALNFFLSILPRDNSAHAQTTDVPNGRLPTSDNPVVASIFDSAGQATDLQPTFVFAGNVLRVQFPQPGRSFKPGAYAMKLWLWRNGTIYFSENNFRWGVLAVNFDKTIFMQGDTAHIGFGVLTDTGHTVCDATIDMDVVSPSGKVLHFSTNDKKIVRNSSCGPATVTNNPDYSASLTAGEIGTYSVSVVAQTANGTRKLSDSFEVQNLPVFDVSRSAPTRIFPPAPYHVSIAVKANADFSGNITETIPALFNISTDSVQPSQNATADKQQNISGLPAQTGDTQTLSWPVNLKKGDSITLGYSFKAPEVSPELYKLGPAQFLQQQNSGEQAAPVWKESRQWQIAADAIAAKVIFLTGTASSTWTVPNNWNNSSNTIEVIGGGGGGGKGTGVGTGGGGGGGGAYAKIANGSSSLTAGATITINIGAGGAAAASGTDTWFNSSTCAAASVCAKAGALGTTGAPGLGGVGGSSTLSIGTTKFGGGNGANSSSSATGAGGGGGAAGPRGAGQSITGGTGGTGDNGNAAGGAAGSPGGPGATGTTPWVQTVDGALAGGGGGGGGANVSQKAGGAGGTYGAAGGGGTRTTAGGVGRQGIIVITYTPVTITLGDGTEPAGVTIKPGGNATSSDVFTFVTNNGTSTITNVTTTIATSTGIYQVQITNDAGSTVYGSSTNPTTSTLGISLSSMNVSSSATNFRILVKPLNATSMPAVPGGTYTVTSTIAGWIDSKSLDQAGANTTSSVITIDNASPGDVTGASGSAGNTQVTLNWTVPGDSDLATTTVLRATSSISVTPVEGTYYTVGNTINTTTTVACVTSSTAGTCTDTGLTNGTVYYYKIFTADTFLNYSAGVTPTGNPFTPSANSPPAVSSVSLNHGNAIVLTPNATTSFDINYTVTDTNGCSDVVNTTSTAYRGGVSSTCAVFNPTANNLNCYIFTTHTTSSCSANAFRATDTVAIYYFAQATGDSSSSFPSDHWFAFATAKDAANATGTSSSSAVDVGVLLAINVTPATTNYGTVLPNTDTGSTNQTETVQNAGNTSATLKLSGTALALGANLITTSSQHYATSTFTFGGSEQQLSGTATAVSGFLLTAPTSTNAVSSIAYWGISIPSLPTGTYSGVNIFTAVWSQ